MVSGGEQKGSAGERTVGRVFIAEVPPGVGVSEIENFWLIFDSFRVGWPDFPWSRTPEYRKRRIFGWFLIVPGRTTQVFRGIAHRSVGKGRNQLRFRYFIKRGTGYRFGPVSGQNPAFLAGSAAGKVSVAENPSRRGRTVIPPASCR